MTGDTLAGVAASLTTRDCEVLDEIWHATDGDRWLRPLDCGAFDGSDHSYRLKRLSQKCLVERARRNSIANDSRSSRGSYVYRLTPLGLALRDYLNQERQS